MDPKKDIKEDPLADVNLASLNQRRIEAVEKQKAAADAVQTGKADHFLRYWLGGGAMFFVAVVACPDACRVHPDRNVRALVLHHRLAWPVD